MPESSDRLTLSAPPDKSAIKRRRGRPQPRFLSDVADQLDVQRGCPEAMVPAEHLSRTVWELIELLDTHELESGYSSLGRRGFHPKRVLAVWVYASLTGVHAASKVAEATKTDLAYRLLSGGHTVGVSTLKDFRQHRGEFLQRAIEQTTVLAMERGLLDTKQCATDSARIQADASTKSVRTVVRSKKRLDELSQADVADLDEDERAVHQAKLDKHRQALERCEREGRTSHSVTDPLAGLIKFPNGASLPGHRVTVTACGTQVRFVVSVLLSSYANDFNHLEEAVLDARRVLEQTGACIGPEGVHVQLAADPGYLGKDDLRFAEENRDWVDILIHEPAAPKRGRSETTGGYFGKDRFVIHDDDSATCPAGRAMRGPYRNGRSTKRMWKGDGCPQCPLKQQCTKGKQRAITQDLETDRLHGARKERMAKPDAKARYNKRIATVEPVFSYIEDAMGFRRCSSRHADTVRAEILLKVLAYNLMRLRAGRPVSLAFFAGTYGNGRMRISAAWVPTWRVIADLAIPESNPEETAAQSRLTGPKPTPRGAQLLITGVRSLFSAGL